MGRSEDELLKRLSDLENRTSVLLGESPRSSASSLDELARRLGISPEDDGLTTAPHEHFVSVFAGTVGGVLDLGGISLRERISDSLTSEEMHQRIDGLFKKKMGELTGGRGTVAIDNIRGGADHRLVGPTHDVFRLLKTIHGVRSGTFESNVKNVRILTERYGSRSNAYLKVESTSDALFLVLLHWAADFFSSRSLPIPGWSLLAEIDDQKFVTWLFRAYREGANLRTAISQLLSNLSGVALISVILTVYRYADLFFITEKIPFSIERLNLGRDYKYRFLSRNAALVATGVSTGNALLTQDFFNWNYVAMMKFWSDGRAVNAILDARLREIDQRTERLLVELGG